MLVNQQKMIIFFLWLFTIPLFLSAANSQEPEKIEKVVVSGIGIDAEKAKQNAIRNAVEQVIGVYVSADTIVANSQLIKDEILSYSGGYVKEVKTILQKKEDDGLFTVQIEALVVSNKLKKKLESINIAIKKIEGESLFGEAFSKVEETKNADELLSHILSKYPIAAYIIEAGKPMIKSTDPKNNTALISIPLIIRWDKTFIDEFSNILSKVSKEQFADTDIESMSRKTRAHKVLCFSKKAILKSGKAEFCVLLEKDSPSKRNTKKSLINPPVSSNSMSLTINLKDKNNNIVEADTYTFAHKDSDSPERQGLRLSGDRPILRTELSGEGFTPPNTLWRDLYGRNILLLTDGEFILNAETKVTIENMNNISFIEIKFNSWEN